MTQVQQIYTSALAMIVLGALAIASLLFHMVFTLSITLLLAMILPIGFAFVTAPRVGETCRGDGSGVTAVIRHYTLLSMIPLFGLALALNMTNGEIGGGSSTVNGHTSYMPVYKIGLLSRPLCLRQVIFNLMICGGLAAFLFSQ